MPETSGPFGILGGTFDPVHRAHLNLARAARKQLCLDNVLWIPTGQPPHRQLPQTPAAHRLAMVRLAIAAEPGFELDAAEAMTDEPSFTVPTLERLRGIHGAARPLVLLVGADAFLGLPSWHRWRDIFRLAHVAVASRPGADLNEANMAADLADMFRRCRGNRTALAAAPAGAIVGFEIEPVEPPDLSATMIRARLRGAAALPADLLPPAVLDYIRLNHLYSA